jgi:hypothetical protein
MASLGAYVGQVAPGNQAALDDLSTKLGDPVDYAVTFLDQRSWDAFEKSASWTSSQWAPDQKLLYSVPLTVEGTSLADVASGAKNGHFHAAAEAIAADDPNATIRIGWESNGDWFPWAASHDPQGYIDAYREVVDQFRAVSPDFKFDWCVNIGAQAMDPAKAYPGDDYVDTVGLDMNITSYGRSPEKVWDDTLHQPSGLEWHAAFAAAHGKPMSYAEWGSDMNEGSFVEHMGDWINSHDVAFQSYWDSNDNFGSKLDENPVDQQAYLAAFGAQNDYWHG